MVLALAKVIFSGCVAGVMLSHGSSIIKIVMVHLESMMTYLLPVFVMCLKEVVDTLVATSPWEITCGYIGI